MSHPCRVLRPLAVGIAILAILSGSAFARVNWVLKSSTTGDLPAPNEGNEQTCCVVCDIDKDGVDDFIVGERTKAPSVVWYKYNGKGWAINFCNTVIYKLHYLCGSRT